MSWKVFRRTLSLPFLFSLSLGLFLFAFLMSAVYPTVQAQFTAALRLVPSFLKPLIQNQLGAGSFEGFVSMAYSHPFFVGLFGIWAIALAADSVAGEIERNTLGLMLSYPLSRFAFQASKIFAMLVGCAWLSLMLLPGFWLGFELFGFRHSGPGPYFWASLATFLLYSSLGALTAWASAWASEAAFSAKLGALALLSSFFLNYVAQLYEPLKAYRFLSLFAYYDPKSLLAGNPMAPRDLLVLSGVLAIGLLGAFITFRRRDLSI